MDKSQHTRLLRGEGKQYKNTNLYVLEGNAHTIEERASKDICPPTHLNPAYLPDPKAYRPGRLPQQQQQQRARPRQIKEEEETHKLILQY
jgi:hypothetical protein